MEWAKPLRTVRAINFDVKKGISEIHLLCRSYGEGSVTFELISSKKVYTEKDLKISEKISANLHGIFFFHREKTAVLSSTNALQPGQWTAYFYPHSAIIRYVEILVD
ncbi:hypothetical protein [[Eubacterium] cellulosolvens]